MGHRVGQIEAMRTIQGEHHPIEIEGDGTGAARKMINQGEGGMRALGESRFMASGILDLEFIGTEGDAPTAPGIISTARGTFDLVDD